MTFGGKGEIADAMYELSRHRLSPLPVTFASDLDVLAARSVPSSGHVKAFQSDMMIQSTFLTGKLL